jgi:hypothetical protein
MSFYPPRALGSRFSGALQGFRVDDSGQSFTQALPAEVIDAAARSTQLDFAGGADAIYTPAVTLWAFLAQVLSGSKSCVAAVARVMVLRLALGLPACSAHTGGYCKARAKLAEPFLQQLTYTVGDHVEDQAPDTWRWHGRRVLLADGTEVTLPDTPENQQAYPQPNTQQPGLGFPMIRLVVLLTFATACLVGAAYGPHQGKETGETALLRQLLDRLRAGDVVVADRFHCSYWQIVLLQERGVDVAFRLHQRRDFDFRRGRRLSADDHIVTWVKPARPDWMDADTYARLPATLTVRELRFGVAQRGYRTRTIIVATTLLDDGCYTKAALADLYHQRWHVELDLRSIKQTLRMDMLTCKTPAMAQRELWVHLLGYNLVRQALAQAARQRGLSPRQLSFAGALQTLEAFRWQLLLSTDAQRAPVTLALLLAVGTHEVGDRPGRCEPRRVKRRPKSYGLLVVPRAEARAELLNN